LSDAQGQRQIENGFEPESFHQRAAAEQGQRVGRSPDKIVSADGARQGHGVAAFTDKRLDGGPKKTHADVEQSGGNNHTGCVVRLRAGSQRENHHAKPDFERGEVSVALGEPSSLPGGDGVNEAVQCGKSEIVLVAKAKLVPHVKIEVIGIERR
jgi:hypothetical protein